MAKKSIRAIASAMDCEEPKRYLPRLTLTESDIPALSDMKIKGVQEFTIKARLVALREDEWGYNNDLMEATFRIESVNGKNITSNYDDKDDDGEEDD